MACDDLGWVYRPAIGEHGVTFNRGLTRAPRIYPPANSAHSCKRQQTSEGDMRRRPGLGSLVGALSLAVLAITASIAAPARADDAWRPDPSLYEAAKKESEVVLYTTHIVDQIVRPLMKSFQTSAPGINVKYVRADGLALVVRLTNEGRAGRVQSDVWCMVDGVQALLDGSFAAEFEVPNAKGLPAELVDPKHRWIATNVGVRSAAYNTQTVPKQYAPKSYQDLLDPRWKGKIVWNPKSMTGAWGFISTVIKGMGDVEGMTYLR